MTFLSLPPRAPETFPVVSEEGDYSLLGGRISSFQLSQRKRCCKSSLVISEEGCCKSSLVVSEEAMLQELISYLRGSDAARAH